MTTKGLRIDTRAIAEGLYKMIPPDDKRCMIVGMLPATWMAMFERLLREKLVKCQYPDAKGEELDKLAKILDKDLVQDVMYAFTVDMLAVATEDGLCVV